MKDSFISEGKKYISARRASEISDYSADYIGQLCRAEKLDCRMIGRSWFVTEESLHLHRANVLHNEIYRNRIQNLKGEQATNSGSLEQNASESRPAHRVLVEPSVVVSEPASAGISYSPDARPLFPDLSKGSQPMTEPVAATAPIAPRILHVPVRPVRSPMVARVSDVRREIPVASAGSISRRVWIRRPAASIALIVALFFVIAAAGIVATSPQSDPLSSFLNGQYRSLLALVGHGDQLGRTLPLSGTGQTGQSNDVSNSQPIGAGMAVVPATGTSVTDDAAKAYIQNSFSDQVVVHADKNGTAGVITPVFKDAKSKDFLYVLVPVKSATSSANQAQR